MRIMEMYIIEAKSIFTNPCCQVSRVKKAKVLRIKWPML